MNLAPVSPLNESNEFLLQLPLSPRFLEVLKTTQIKYDVPRLAKVHLLQEIAHLDFHVFYHASDVRDVRCLFLQRVILFRL